MRPHRSPLTLALLLLASAAVAAVYMRRPPAATPLVETLPPLPDSPEPPAWTADLRPPQPSEVVAALDRTFSGAIPPEAVQVHRALAGDFNGDGSPDLVAPARAFEERLPVLQSETANWIVQDPAAPRLGPEPDPPYAPVSLAKDERLLVVLHGHAGAGWRDPAARQGYVLKATFANDLLIRKRDDVLAAAGPKAPMPYLFGDLILDTAGRRFLYWTGARYAWRAMPGSTRSASSQDRRSPKESW